MADFTSGEFTMDSIPYGEYDVRIRTPLLRQEKRITVLVHKPTHWFTLTLPFPAPVDPWEEPDQQTSMRGQVTGVEAHRYLIWVKIVGVFSDIIVETSTNSDGMFEIPVLPDGKYVALFTVPDSDPSVVAFDYLRERGVVKFDLSTALR